MKEKDPNERVEFGRHWGDWSVPFIAVLFLVAFLAWVFSNPLKGLDRTDQVLNRIDKERTEKAEKLLRQRDIDAAVATGVVTVGIPPARKKQP